MVNIDFLVPGFSKCGTTTLCSLLNQHPDIFIPKNKEPWYFSSPRYNERHEDYIHLFKHSTSNQRLGEGSTVYSGYRTEDITLKRIKPLFPECRFIFIARNPISRIESSFREMHHSGIFFGLDAPYILGDAMESFPEMVEDSMYWNRISKYIDAYGNDKVLVLFLEELKQEPERLLKTCFEHLGVDSEFEIKNEQTQLNAGNTKLYDTKLLRKMRNHRFTGPKISKIKAENQDKYFKPLRLRKPFTEKVIWDAKAMEYYLNRIKPNSDIFLEKNGKARDFWPNTMN
jgi:hypothetical protein